MYPQQLPPTDGSYWLQDAVSPQESTTNYCLPNQISQEASYGDFPPFTTDLFQPEEIFQLDQPLRSDFSANPQELARSPPTLLDLGSGTIKYEVKQQTHDQVYWNQFLSEDSSSSHLSLPQDERLHFPSFESEKDSSDYVLRRNMHHYVQEKEQNLSHPVNDAVNYQSYPRAQNQKNFVEGSTKSDYEQSYWTQDQQDNRLHFSSFDGKEQDQLSSRREVDCYNKNSCQPPLVSRTEYNLYQRPKINDPHDATRQNRSPESKQYLFDDYQQIIEHNDNKNNQSHNGSAQNSTRLNLDDRLHYGNHENPEATERLFHDSVMIETPVQNQNSSDPFFYPNNDRCPYTCEILDRLPQTMNAGSAHGTINNYGDQIDANLDMPPFVDYTLVGMLCSSAEEHTSNLLPSCPQDSHSYIPHH